MAARASGPALSVVIPTYNGQDTIGRAVASVVSSSAVVEVIVVDDGSTDRTAEVVGDISDERVILISQPNRGRSAARNEGLRRATGGFVLFLDDDDFLGEGTVDRLVDAFAQRPNALLARLHAQDHLHTGEPGRVIRATSSLYSSSMLAGSFAVQRDLLDEVGGYDEQLDFSENTDLLFRVDDVLRRRGTDDAVVVVDHIGLHYMRRGDAATRYRSSRIRASRRLLATHRDRLEREPQLHSVILGILAHDLYRNGRAVEALAPAWASLRRRPSLRSGGRLLRIVGAGARKVVYSGRSVRPR